MIGNYEYNSVYGFSALVDAERLLAKNDVFSDDVQDIALTLEHVGQRKLITSRYDMFENCDLYIELKGENPRTYVWVLKVVSTVSHTYSSLPFTLET